MWGATNEVRKAAGLTLISIHAPRVGSDVMINALLSESDISIHAPRVGSDLPRPGGKAARHDDFNPRSPCGERLSMILPSCISVFISIHAPRVGSDRDRAGRCRLLLGFQSTLPVWGATFNRLVVAPVKRISIHAPRVGSDYNEMTAAGVSADFNPRSPCGERPEDGAGLPAVPGISIHAPRVGSDGGQGCSLLLPTEFQSTLPVWGATIALTQPALGDVISIHAPRVGSDWDIPFFRGAFFISIHAPRVGSDSRKDWKSMLQRNFNPRSPCGERLQALFNLQG